MKLTDFGTSKGLPFTFALAETFVGTEYYMSPERMNSEKYSLTADIWSLGLIIYELATLNKAYLYNPKKENTIAFYERIINGPAPSLD